MTCVICKHGETQKGTTVLVFQREGTMVVILDVPAQVCQNCGEAYVNEQISEQVMKQVERAAREEVLVDIRRFAA